MDASCLISLGSINIIFDLLYLLFNDKFIYFKNNSLSIIYFTFPKSFWSVFSLLSHPSKTPWGSCSFRPCRTGPWPLLEWYPSRAFQPLHLSYSALSPVTVLLPGGSATLVLLYSFFYIKYLLILFIYFIKI